MRNGFTEQQCQEILSELVSANAREIVSGNAAEGDARHTAAPRQPKITRSNSEKVRQRRTLTRTHMNSCACWRGVSRVGKRFQIG